MLNEVQDVHVEASPWTVRIAVGTEDKLAELRRELQKVENDVKGGTPERFISVTWENADKTRIREARKGTLRFDKFSVIGRELVQVLNTDDSDDFGCAEERVRQAMTCLHCLLYEEIPFKKSNEQGQYKDSDEDHVFGQEFCVTVLWTKKSKMGHMCFA